MATHQLKKTDKATRKSAMLGVEVSDEFLAFAFGGKFRDADISLTQELWWKREIAKSTHDSVSNAPQRKY